MLSILSYLRQGEYFLAIIVILSRCFIVFCCMPIHELSHGLMANKLGDDTAKLQGRLTFNPFAHLDPLGTIMIFFFGIGYAKPVPVNPSRLKHPRRDMALVALAGPLSNLIMGFIFVFIYYAVNAVGSSSTVVYAISYFFYFAASVNVTLAVFNLIPIPPLDGSKILTAVLPDKAYFKFMQYERYIMIALLILLFIGVLDTPISYLSNIMMRFISIIPRLIFG
ncbi:MAG: site-2 protease family protein [Clostridiales bacterium]|nr:site-2 protease family protein [Clostridiales bacterium]